eukprot:comp4418_c0_seq1/m.2994 comp4418_c0_seq1/g.2994  ORF comp4418_c0_seq1/g.2994 comp4418_c0_seq1/m.2994 type:complete len:355 (-) comp4418_c0_seq1:643-1707(-)
MLELAAQLLSDLGRAVKLKRVHGLADHTREALARHSARKVQQCRRNHLGHKIVIVAQQQRKQRRHHGRLAGTHNHLVADRAAALLGGNKRVNQLHLRRTQHDGARKLKQQQPRVIGRAAVLEVHSLRRKGLGETAGLENESRTHLGRVGRHHALHQLLGKQDAARNERNADDRQQGPGKQILRSLELCGPHKRIESTDIRNVLRRHHQRKHKITIGRQIAPSILIEIKERTLPLQRSTRRIIRARSGDSAVHNRIRIVDLVQRHFNRKRGLALIVLELPMQRLQQCTHMRPRSTRGAARNVLRSEPEHKLRFLGAHLAAVEGHILLQPRHGALRGVGPSHGIRLDIERQRRILC